MAINPKIKQKAEDIRKKIFGAEVRESLASGLEGMSEDVESIKGRQGNVENQFQDVLDETTGKDVISAPELIAARNGKSNLKTRLDEEHQEVTAQLQQTTTELDITKKETLKRQADNRKLSETRLSRFIEKDTFDTDLSLWEQTGGIEIVDGKMAMTSGSKSHTNVAFFKGISDVRGIEATIGSESNSIYTRIAFGKDTSNFFWIGVNSSDSITWRLQGYKVVGGELGSAITVSPGTVFNNGDKIRVILHRQNIQVFKNNELINTLSVTPSYPYILTNEPVMAGVSFRSASSSWQVDEARIIPNKPRKYLHFSIDDVWRPMRNLIDNEDSYSSIFDEPNFKYFKDMNDKYGATFSLYVFYEWSGGNLSQVPTKFQKELRENADWLKFGFHGYNSESNYGMGPQGTHVPTADAINHWNTVVNEIVRFSSEYNVDTVPRLGFYGGILETCRAFRNDVSFPAKGFLAADDTRSNNYYLNSVQRDSLIKCDDLYDVNENLYFIRTDLRIETFDNPLGELQSRKNDLDYAGQMDILEVFTHDGATLTDNFDKIEDVFKWALKEGYIFAFPQDYIPES